MTTREVPEYLCASQDPEMFLSTLPAAHEECVKFCAACPAFDRCRKETETWLAGAYGLGTDGTLAGLLYRDGRVVDLSRNRCEHCGLRAKRKQSRYCSRICTSRGHAARGKAS